MYSSFFTGPGSYSLTLDSGQNASLTYNSSGSIVAVGEVNSQILRSDVPLENGVMHVSPSRASPEDPDAG